MTNCIRDKHINPKKSKITNDDMVIGDLAIINFLEDGIDNLSMEEIDDITNSSTCIEDLIQKVNLNKNKPQHHNILYTNVKSCYGMVYKNNKWDNMKITDIINDIIEAKTIDLNRIINDSCNELDDKAKGSISSALNDISIDKYDYFKHIKPEDNCGENYRNYNKTIDKLSTLRTRIRKLLADNREIVKKTKNNPTIKLTITSAPSSKSAKLSRKLAPLGKSSSKSARTKSSSKSARTKSSSKSARTKSSSKSARTTKSSSKSARTTKSSRK